MIIYSDGSKLDTESTGLGVYAEINQKEIFQISKYLGKTLEVYDAELLAIQYALKRAKLYLQLEREDDQYRVENIYIFVDNQASIKRIQSTKPGPGQQNAIIINTYCEDLKQIGIKINIIWSPGHTSIKGNDIADSLAKQGALNQRNEKGLRLHSMSYIKRLNKQAIFNIWKQKWNKGYKGKSYIGKPRLQYPKELHQSSKDITSRITQLALGHGYFKSYLYNLPNSNTFSPECNCNVYAWEDPKHILLKCSKYSEQRKELLKE